MSNPQLPSAEEGAFTGDLTPVECWDILKKNSDAVLIDVRTDAEFVYVGVPDLASLGKEAKFVSWMLFPKNEPNPQFVEQLAAVAPDRDACLLFLCRSGIRSRFAAAAASKAGYRQCYNILQGFEGDRNSAGHRNTIGGWKMAKLPWIQG